jgi:protein disulfide-isomerase A1
MMMNKIALFLAFLCLGAVFAHEGHDHHHDHDHEHESEESSETAVVVLDDTNFDKHIGENELTLVEFYAPWCGHCKALVPEYDQASIMLQGQASLAKVDCTAFRELCTKYDVQGFPTIKLFRSDGSEPQDYDQARKADAIAKFMLKQKQSAYVEPKTKEEVDKLAASEFAIVAFVDASDKDAIEAFVSVAKALRNEYEFGLVTESSLFSSYSVAAKRPTAVIYRKFDEPQVTFSAQEFNKDTLVDFIIDNAFPLMGTIGPENYQKYVERGYPLAWFFVNLESDAEKEVLASAAEVAKEFKSEISFVKLDGVRWADHAKTFGLSGTTPGIVIEDRENRKNYVFPASTLPTVDNLRAHFKGFIDQSISPTVKSEEPPADNDGPVTIVVGKTFDAIVMDATKDVFVEFYAPWCGHCKTLSPKFDKLGEAFNDVDSVIIAKVDATENDTPADIKGFPTLFFYPANDKENPVQYDGERTEGAMEKWIRSHASTLNEKQEGRGGKAPHDEL